MSTEPRVYRSLQEVQGAFGPCALSIGNFDGVHAGHRRILRRVVALARQHGWKPSALTFDPHPATIVAPDRAPRLLTTPQRRCGLMGSEGIEQVLVLPFDGQVAHLTPEEFARDVLVKALGVRAALVGANFRFGHEHEGDTTRLEALGRMYGFSIEVIPTIGLRGRTISSSAIRRLIQEGAVALAARLLERPHFLEGAVVPGYGVGSKQTVPTLNLRTESEVLPAGGVYITRTFDAAGGRHWPSVTNIGYRPTFEGAELTVETFLLAPLIGPDPERIRVEFLERLREERKFPDSASLKAQILRDVGRAMRYFRRAERWVRKTSVVRHAD